MGRKDGRRGRREKKRGKEARERKVATKGRAHVSGYLSSFDMMISWVWVAVVRAEKFTIFGTYLSREHKRPAVQHLSHTHTVATCLPTALYMQPSKCHTSNTTHIGRTCLWEAGQGSCL